MSAEPVPARSRPDSDVHLVLGLHDLWLAFDHVRARLAEELDLVPVDVNALLEMHRRPGIRPGDLARSLNLKAAGTTSVTDRLVRTGYARRSADVADRRGTRLDLTPAGEHAVGWILDALNGAALNGAAQGSGEIGTTTAVDVLQSLAGRMRPVRG